MTTRVITLWRVHVTSSGCAPSADSDQPGYLVSLIRLFAKGFKGS